MTKPPFFVDHAIHSENEARNDQSGEYTSTCNEAASIAVLVIATEGAPRSIGVRALECLLETSFYSDSACYFSCSAVRFFSRSTTA